MSKAFGEQNPNQGEDAVSWQTWSDGVGNIPEVTGNADWGKLKLELSGEEGRSAVYDLGAARTRKYTLTENRYGTGAESATLQIRGDTSSFTQDAEAPVWQTYTAPVTAGWRYVQIRATTHDYEQVILDLFGANIISFLKLDDAAGAFLDHGGNGYNGAAGGSTGPTRNVQGVDGLASAVSLPGSNAYINWYSAGLAGAFDGAAGTLMGWFKVSGSGVWTDGSYREVVTLYVDASNYIAFGRTTTNNMLYCTYRAGGTSESYGAVGCTSTTWVHMAITWNKASERTSLYLNGALYASSTGLGVWAGSLSATQTCIGAWDTGPSEVWSGKIDDVVLLDREATATEIDFAATRGRNLVRIAIIGDSIASWASFPNGWSQQMRDTYNGGENAVFNHSVSGASILHVDGFLDMDDETLSAATDNAEIIIITLGTNDEVTTGMQAEVEENIIELKNSNPRATFYYMNVLPRWTDATGDTEVDKSANRAAIAAACTALGVTCWDTYSTPWITAADTNEGLHPNAAGMTKIYNEVMARLP